MRGVWVGAGIAVKKGCSLHLRMYPTGCLSLQVSMASFKYTPQIVPRALRFCPLSNSLAHRMSTHSQTLYPPSVDPVCVGCRCP